MVRVVPAPRGMAGLHLLTRHKHEVMYIVKKAQKRCTGAIKMTRNLFIYFSFISAFTSNESKNPCSTRTSRLTREIHENQFYYLIVSCKLGVKKLHMIDVTMRWRRIYMGIYMSMGKYNENFTCYTIHLISR